MNTYSVSKYVILTEKTWLGFGWKGRQNKINLRGPSWGSRGKISFACGNYKSFTNNVFAVANMDIFVKLVFSLYWCLIVCFQCLLFSSFLSCIKFQNISFSEDFQVWFVVLYFGKVSWNWLTGYVWFWIDVELPLFFKSDNFLSL